MTLRRKEMTAFVSACEHLIGRSREQSLSDDDRALVEFYTQELIKHLDLHLPPTGEKSNHDTTKRHARSA